MQNFIPIIAPVFGALLTCSTTLAHHNTDSVFNTEQEFVIEGVVEKVQWRNPHVYFSVAGTSDSGEENTWRIEAGPTGIMRRLGWSRETLEAGDIVTVTANPSRRSGRASAYLVDVSSPGKDLPVVRGEAARTRLAESGAISDVTATELSGIWVTLLNLEYFGKTMDTEKLPLTEKGRADIDSFDENTMHPALDCIPFVAPMMMATPDIKSIEMIDDTLRIRGEFDNAERIVHLNPNAVAAGPSLHGHSVGHWQDGVLTIETTDFAVHRSGNVFGLSSGDQKKLVETIKLNEDGKTLTYSLVLEDPEYLLEPITGEIQWAYRPDLDYVSLECDLENSRQFLED